MKTLPIAFLLLTSILVGCSSTATPDEAARERELQKAAKTSKAGIQNPSQADGSEAPMPSESSTTKAPKPDYYIDL